ncbi:UNVERIFIED_CONTAM: hypothetical protein Sradi_3203100 [Sesamum radiatum]|uniref:Uncharacterized protein n=1 Tax=Sesamum radiatum TaxID=300843 RepID=A0AAW2RHS4_SESRA
MVWEDVCCEKKFARCYINAYEDMFEDLCVLFGEPVPNEEVVVVPSAQPGQPEDELLVYHDAVSFEEEPAGVNAENPIVLPADVFNIISDSSDSSGDFWRVIEGYYASDSDPESVLAMPGVPSFPPHTNDFPAKMPVSPVAFIARDGKLVDTAYM